jgi:beta-lactamase regulating signal transducer with metallopeptidase domain
MAALWWNNLLLYSVQIGMVVAAAAALPPLLRLRISRARLAFWQIVLGACLLLPFVHPWRQQVVTGEISVTTTILAVNGPAAPAPAVPVVALALGLLGAGALVRLGWLTAGFRRLRRYRRESRPLSGVELPPWMAGRPIPQIRLADITSPVTFGALRPVVLVPARFPALPAEAQNAILSHELLHVARRDWLFTVAEEIVRAVLWFHPAIWWLLAEIQLAREQAVDAEVVRLTQAREEYVDALLAIAGARLEPDLVPAPLFLRRRHLKQRVVSLLEEVRMSKTRLISALAAGLCILFAACWFAAATFPLSAAPQVVNDAAGVSVDTGGAALLHRAGVAYPESARAKGVQGTVTLEVQLDGSGNVADARVVSGPQELRNSTLQSVL